MRPSTMCALLLILLAASSPAAPAAPKKAPKSAPKSGKQDEAAVRARVAAFHKAWAAENWAAMVAMMTPDLQRCGDPDDLAAQLGSHGGEKLVAWSIKTIAPGPKPYRDHLEIECTGETAVIDAVMNVSLTTTMKASGGKPKKVDGVEQTWLKVNGEWDLSVSEE